MIEVYCDNYDCAHCDINRDCCTLIREEREGKQ